MFSYAELGSGVGMQMSDSHFGSFVGGKIANELDWLVAQPT